MRWTVCSQQVRAQAVCCPPSGLQHCLTGYTLFWAHRFHIPLRVQEQESAHSEAGPELWKQLHPRGDTEVGPLLASGTAHPPSTGPGDLAGLGDTPTC